MTVSGANVATFTSYLYRKFRLQTRWCRFLEIKCYFCISEKCKIFTQGFKISQICFDVNIFPSGGLGLQPEWFFAFCLWKVGIFSVKVVLLCFGNQFRTNALGLLWFLSLEPSGKEKSVGLINTNKRGCGEKKHFPKFKDNRTYIFYVTLSSKLSKVIYKVFMKISLNSTKTAFCVIYVK